MPDNKKIVWLEKGHPSAGFEHILIEHGEQFAKQGISKTDLPDFLMTALEKGKKGKWLVIKEKVKDDLFMKLFTMEKNIELQ
ncbi:hypothetical protein HB765_00480 [Listeria welshimeri]|nr:hypothetical protein [Listeria welshimeri]MBC1637509.1 hypothetical protein [Listeria welshimeri]MBC1671757.1 hypothetical protein [Listeria welshimeri]